MPVDWPVTSLVQRFSGERMSTYIQANAGDPVAAIMLYQWNTRVTGAMWEVLGHVEVVVRNAVDARLAHRHLLRERAGTWLNDPAGELGSRARGDIDIARARVHRKGKSPTHGQVISELPLGFWRYLVSKRYMPLWPDIATAFPNAPNRALTTVERPLADVHSFRNRLGHHERVWSQPLPRLYNDMLTLIGYVDADVQEWVAAGSRVADVLDDAVRPQSTSP